MRSKSTFSLKQGILSLCYLTAMFLWPALSKGAIITVGTGTSTTTAYPLNTCYNYSYSQTIYLASDLVAAGATAGAPAMITSIQYNQTTSTSSANWKDWVVYMGTTSSTAFTSTTSWIPVSSMMPVFKGTVTPSGTGWYTITLSTPFVWDGTSNIVIAVDENTYGLSCTSNWQTTTVGSAPNYRSIVHYSDAVNADPLSPPTATTRGLLFPNVKLNYTTLSACSGSPTGGTAIATETSLCPGGTSILTLSGATTATGITYQWEYSATGTSGWSNVSGATKSSLIVNPATCTNNYYRCKLTCGASSSYSSTVAISVACAITPPYQETFESLTAPSLLPNCMKATSI